MKFFLLLVTLVGVVGVSCLHANFEKLITNFSATLSEEEQNLLRTMHERTQSMTPTNPTGEEIDRALTVGVAALIFGYSFDNIDRPYEMVHQTCEKAMAAHGKDMEIVNVLFETNNAKYMSDNANLRSLSAYYSICQHVLKSEQTVLKEKISVGIKKLFLGLHNEWLLDMVRESEHNVTEDEENLLLSLRVNTNSLTNPTRDESIHGIALTVGENISSQENGEIDFSQFDPVVERISGLCRKIDDNFGKKMKSVNVLFGGDDIEALAKSDAFRAISNYNSICQYLLKTDPGVLKKELRADIDAVVERGSY